MFVKLWPPGYQKLRFYTWFSSFDSEIKQNFNFDKLTVPVPVVQKQNEILGDIGLKRADTQNQQLNISYLNMKQGW